MPNGDEATNRTGGRNHEALFKPAGKNLASRWGLFGEVLPGFSGPLDAQITEKGGRQASMVLTLRGAKPPIWNIKFARAMTLASGLTSVRVDLRLVCFLARQGTPERIEAKHVLAAEYRLPGAGQVYELRVAPKYFGRSNQVVARPMPCVGTVFALLPYQVGEVRLDAPARAKAGDVVRVQGRVVPRGDAAAALHAVRLDVCRPDGKPFKGFCTNLLAEQGRFTRDLPLALDEQPGLWRITASDVISRQATLVKLVVTPR